MKIIDYKQAYKETVDFRLMIELNEQLMYKNLHYPEQLDDVIDEAANIFCIPKYLESIHGDMPFILKNRKKMGMAVAYELSATPRDIFSFSDTIEEYEEGLKFLEKYTGWFLVFGITGNDKF